MEKTFVIVKPDAVRRGLLGEVLHRFEEQNLRFAELKLMTMPEQIAHQLYEEHAGKEFFDELVQFMTASPIAVAVLTGESAVSRVRQIMGATDPAKADRGTIRGDLATELPENLVHGSDSPESANREIALFFPDK